MRRFITGLLVGVASAFAAGCSSEYANRGSQGVTVDSGSWLSGGPLVYPTNNERFANGEPMDLRWNR